MKNKLSLIVSIITVSIFLIMTVGYAAYGAHMNITGSTTFKANGEIAITNAVLASYSNLTNPQDPVFDKESITFDVTFNVENNSDLDKEYQAVYDITISNTTFFDYEFASAVFTPSVETLNNQNLRVTYDVTGIGIGEIIPSLTTKTFSLILNMYPQDTGEYNVGGESGVVVEQEQTQPTGNLLASLPGNSQVNLRNGTIRDYVTVTVINSFDTAQGFNFSINNSNFKLVDSNGNNLGNITIPANTTQTYNVYIQQSNNLTFATDYQTANLLFHKSGSNVNLGSVKILVDKDTTLLDSEAPLISNVNATYVADKGKVNLTWSATDVNNISYFIVESYKSSDDSLVDTYNTPDSSRNYQVTGLDDGSYYFKVYGVDSKRNNGKTQATTCTTSEGYCSRSTSSSYQWVFTVTYSVGDNATKNSGPDTVVVNESLTATFSASGFMANLNTPTVTMGGVTLTSGQNGYRYNNGTVTIDHVTGNVTISISGSCLVEGTKILLYNGKYKNIENVTYNDLLAVWDYDRGTLTAEYPIWIEKTKKTYSYQKTTFSDGSILKTVGYHGVFSPTYGEFISVDDTARFKEGVEVYKVIKGTLKKVKIAKIEFIAEEVNYYHVVSSRYYNIIANDFITTDGTVVLSNLYGFKDNITWNSEIRNKVINNKNELYSYSEFEDIMPYYMFNGLRAEEGKFLSKFGLTKDLFRYYLLTNQLSKKMLLDVPTNSDGKRLWMVTTDKDIVLNNKDFLYQEGDYYTLPQVLGVTKWYSTSEDKCYRPLDKVKVNHSMHFIAK